MKCVPVNRIIPFSGVDGPGNRVAIFLQGCNQNCQYCHNPETIQLCCHCGACVPHCPTGALHMENGRVCYDPTRCCQCDQCIRQCRHDSNPRIRWMTAEEVFEDIAPNLAYARGITVSGGECTLYPEFLAELSKLAHAQDKTLFIDTNGQIPLRECPALVQAIDSAMIDLKASGTAEFLTVTEQRNDAVTDNITYMASLGKLYEIRTVLCPDIMDIRKTVSLGASLIAAYPSVRYKLIRYRSNGVREKYAALRLPTEDEVLEAAALAKAQGAANVIII